MKPRQGRIVEVGRKDFAEQHIIPNVQCHQLAIVQQMIKRVTCTIIHSELGLQEPSRRFVANDMRVEWRGEYIIQPSADRAKGAFSVGLGTTGSFGCGGWKLGDATYFGWPNQAFKVLDMRENV